MIIPITKLPTYYKANRPKHKVQSQIQAIVDVITLNNQHHRHYKEIN
jgi:hypothetical protein